MNQNVSELDMTDTVTTANLNPMPEQSMSEDATALPQQQAEQEYTIDSEFETLLPPKTSEQYETLKDGIRSEGKIRNPPVVWKEKKILLDGHHRVRIGNELGIKPPIDWMSFASRDDAKMWVLENQLEQHRNLNPFQRIELALKSKPIYVARAKANQQAAGGAVPKKSSEPVNAIEAVAKLAGVSSDPVKKVEKILARTNDEAVTKAINALRRGDAGTSINGVYQKYCVDEKIVVKNVLPPSTPNTSKGAVSTKSSQPVETAPNAESDVELTPEAINATAHDANNAISESIATQLETATTGMSRIICGDTLTEMRKMPDGSVDLIVTSPPYNVKSKTGGATWSGRRMTCKMKAGYDIYADNLPRDEYIAWQRKCLTEMMRLIPDDGAIFYNHKWRVLNGLLEDQSAIVEGFPVRQKIIWHRPGGMNHNPRFFMPNYEEIYVIAKPKFKLVSRANGKGCVWRILRERNNEHPYPFPIELPYQIIESTAAKVILDPFVGSGTTAVAAKMLGRDFIGIELSPRYVAMAEECLNRTRRVCTEVRIPLNSIAELAIPWENFDKHCLTP
jgi:modification methylase